VAKKVTRARRSRALAAVVDEARLDVPRTVTIQIPPELAALFDDSTNALAAADRFSGTLKMFLAMLKRRR
jgi:hypothetical protein